MKKKVDIISKFTFTSDKIQDKITNKTIHFVIIDMLVLYTSKILLTDMMNEVFIINGCLYQT